MSEELLGVERLIDLYNEVYEEAYPYNRPRGRWIASSMGYCLRRQQYERGLVPQGRSFDMKTLRTFQWGRFLHTKVRNILDDFGLLLAEEVPLWDPELQVAGHMDGVVGGTPSDNFIPNSTGHLSETARFRKQLRGALSMTFGEPPYPITIQEYKSVNSKGMERQYRENKPYHHQIIQLATYRILVERNPDQLVTAEGIAINEPEAYQLVCIGKDSWGVLVWGLTQHHVDEARERIDQLNATWQAREVAPCDCEPWMPKFGMCSYPTTDEAGKIVGCCSEDLATQVDWEA